MGNKVDSCFAADSSFSVENGEKTDCGAILDSLTGIIGTPNIFFTPGALRTEAFTKRDQYKDKNLHQVSVKSSKDCDWTS